MGCNHDCSNCSENCEERTAFEKEKLNEMSSVKKVIAVISGKGGVGKSMVTSMLAVSMNRIGYHSAILDADITGPSIPKVFGIREKALGSEFGIIPARTKTGIDLMSINLLLPNDTDPVVWRGPIIAGTVKQFWTEVLWKDVDYMFVDMPPGTGDVPLTVFQSLPIDGVIIVTTPQELVSMIVEKAVNMAKLMDVPILGLVENMAYFKCDQCGKEHYIFGESKAKEAAEKFGIPVFAAIPISPDIASVADKGLMELYEGDWLAPIVSEIEKE